MIFQVSRKLKDSAFNRYTLQPVYLVEAANRQVVEEAFNDPDWIVTPMAVLGLDEAVEDAKQKYLTEFEQSTPVSNQEYKKQLERLLNRGVGLAKEQLDEMLAKSIKALERKLSGD